MIIGLVGKNRDEIEYFRFMLLEGCIFMINGYLDGKSIEEICLSGTDMSNEVENLKYIFP